MTRMQTEKTKLLQDAIKNIKAIRHLTGNNDQVTQAQHALEDLKKVI